MAETKPRHLKVSARAARALLAPLWLIASACGSDQAEQTPSGKCQQGDTRTCAGPGACNGAQSCDASGVWSACDCGGGGGGGASGSGGASGGGGAGGSGGASGSSGGSAGAQCPVGQPGAPMVLVPTLSGGHYCVDSTEATQLHYELFLQAKPSTAGQPGECGANASFVPQSVAPGKCYDSGGTFNPWQYPNRPVVCVDWCDAAAYCKWAGKRLCGKIGGGPADATKLADAHQSEWYNACSKGGTQAYPYGDAWDFKACAYGGQPPPSVKSHPKCVGGFPGLHDMSSSAAEWEDSCTASGCVVRGGSATLGPSGERCDALEFLSRAGGYGAVGFRCCAETGGK